MTGNEPIEGLTIHQHIAAMCLQGILSNPKLYEDFRDSGVDMEKAHEFYAVVAVDHADALIHELSSKEIVELTKETFNNQSSE